MSATLEFGFTTDAKGAEAEAIRAGLLAHRDQVLPPQPGGTGRHPFCFFHRDTDGAVRGGLVGEVSLSWGFVDKFWVDALLRGQGLGRRLLGLAEEFSRQQGAIGLHLHTSTFQAPDFYKKLGYVEIGRLEDRPPGMQRFWLAKRWG